MRLLGKILRRMSRPVQRFTNPYQRRLGLLVHDRRPAGCPLEYKWFLNSHGFTCSTGLMCGIKPGNAHLYLNDIQRWQTRHISPRYNIIFDDKLLSERVFGSIIKTPERLAFLFRGTAVSPSGEHLDPGAVLDLISAAGRAVLKPLAGAKGTDVCVLSCQDGVLLRDGTPAPDGLLAPRDPFLLTAFAVQHPYAADIYPGSVNTIRIVTLQDDAGGFVAVAVHRFGTSASAPVDNFSRQGAVAPIDNEGKLGRLAVQHKATCTVRLSEKHPDTDAQVSGVQVPNWAAVRNRVLAAHGSLPQVPVIAWDIAIDPVGEPIMIEANASTDVDVVQIHAPLLADDRVRRFYGTHGVINLG